jgi:hypothetical protein
MKARRYLDEEELHKRATEALMEKLGPVGMNRFLSLATRKRTESVKRHQRWQAQLEKERFFNDIFKHS